MSDPAAGVSLRMGIPIAEAGGQGVPRLGRGLTARRDLRQRAGPLIDDGRPVLLLAIDGDRIHTENTSQLAQHRLRLDPQFGTGALDAHRQDMVQAVRHWIRYWLSAAGPIPAPDLSHVPAQTQGAQRLRRILGRRHDPSPPHHRTRVENNSRNPRDGYLASAV